jgi:integrase
MSLPQETVLPQIRLTYTNHTLRANEYRFRNWLKPLLDYPMESIGTSDLEMKVVKPMLEAGRKPTSIGLVAGLFSTIWHRARNLELVTGDSPVTAVKIPKIDNRRVRFLTPAEAARLLAALKERSVDTHDFALLSLFTGLRIGECAALTWADVDFENGLIFVKDTKNKNNRHAFMTAEVRAMLKRRRETSPEIDLVFLGRRGGRRNKSIYRPFQKTVKALGFNEGITDLRQTVVFHTLRHSFASWLVMKGKPLYTVSQLMGHRDIKMTERYAHLAPEVIKGSISRLEGFLAK